METSLIGQGLELMLAGMGTVFVFLTVLVFATMMMSRVVLSLGSKKSPGDITAEEVAAISAAIETHRRHKQT